MNITKQNEADKLVLFLDGKLDTVTAPQLDAALKEAFEECDQVEVNLENLAYVSSAGLRVLLSAQKTMNKQGEMKVTGANDELKEIFDVTGFVDILNIE